MPGSTRLAGKQVLTGVVALSILLGAVQSVRGYEPLTHREISQTAVGRSRLAEVLKSQYGVEDGIALRINGQEIREWVGIGGSEEDLPSTRALNHFHNPLQPWPQAGGPLGESSIYWQQNPNQGAGGTWSWPVARRRFLDSLSLPNKGDRETALADTARALGQVMHMVQDATSPAHTREDPHLVFDGYEARIEELRRTNPARFDELLTARSRFPSPTIFTATGDPRAPVPIARLIDSDTYRGTIESYTTGGTIGLAEYTNGGYVSDDTIFLDFPLPRRASLGEGFCDPPPPPPSPPSPPCAPGSRQYFPKVADGDSVPHFVAEGTLLERLRFRGQLLGGFILEDRVYEDYATHLLPRAVGYSAELLNYFFRGKLDVDLVVSAGDSAQLELRLINRSDEVLGSGTLSLYFDDPAGVRCPVPSFGSEPVPDAASGCPQGNGALPVADSFQPNTELPRVAFARPAGSKRLILVYRGTLGNEVPVPNTDPTRDFPGAVIGKVLGQPLKVAFIGVVNGVDGFYLASEQGLFRIPVPDQPSSIFDMVSISWGSNDNILLLGYFTFGPTGRADSSLKIHRINRPRGSDKIPVKGTDPATGLEFVDTTVLDEFVGTPNVPLGTMTINLQVNAMRSIHGSRIIISGPTNGPVQTQQTDFTPLYSDTIVIPFTETTNINLDSTQQTRPGAFALLMHAFVDEKDELIQLWSIKWAPGNLVQDQEATVKSLGTNPPIPDEFLTPGFGQPDPNRFCHENTQTDFTGSASTTPGVQFPIGSFNKFLDVSPTDFCTLKIRPGLLPRSILVGTEDYVLLNRSKGQILAKSFTNPTFSWEEDIHVLSAFRIAFGRQGTEELGFEENILYRRHDQLSSLAINARESFPDPDVINSPYSDVHNFTTTGQDSFGVSSPAPLVFTKSQANWGVRLRQTGVFESMNIIVEGSFDVFTNNVAVGEQRLIANEENFLEFFPLTSKGGLVLLARTRNSPSQYRVVRLPLPAQAGTTIAAQYLTAPVTSSTGGSFRTILEANEDAILAQFYRRLTLPPEKFLFISGPEDTVREVLGADLPEDLRVILPSGFIKDFPGKRKEQTPEFLDGTVTFTPNATPEKDLLLTSTFPNVQTLEVSPGHKPQWHALGQ